MARLKGGCPSVFSRVSSELAALSAAGVAVELVPGISSGLAAPLLAGERWSVQPPGTLHAGIASLQASPPLAVGRHLACARCLALPRQQSRCAWHAVHARCECAVPPPGHAGFPLTDRDAGRSFAVLSAHAPDQVDWGAHRGVDTLVLLMAGAALQSSVAGMLRAGWPADTPVQGLRQMLAACCMVQGMCLQTHDCTCMTATGHDRPHVMFHLVGCMQ